MPFPTLIPPFFDADRSSQRINTDSTRIDWLRLTPFLVLHLACILPIWVGWSPFALTLAIGCYYVRMFAITAGYHRLLAHRAYKAPAWFTVLIAFIGNMSAQRGPLWWAAHHREHHRHSDETGDLHSAKHHGMLDSHVLWFMRDRAFVTKYDKVKDWDHIRSLRLMNRFDWIAPLLLLGLCYGAGLVAPLFGIETTPWQCVAWGFVISTVALFHGTFTINSLAHRWGSRRYETTDLSRNNLWLNILTMGEGWHNNHHHYANSARQGFFWWEIDPTYYILKTLRMLRIIGPLKPVPNGIKYPRE